MDLATAQFQLLQEAKNAIDLKGPNATEMGDKTGGSNAASGRAIIASQQGGMTQLAHLTDRLRNLDIRVFRAVWARIRQFWTAEKWIRVTDDEQKCQMGWRQRRSAADADGHGAEPGAGAAHCRRGRQRRRARLRHHHRRGAGQL